MNLSSYQKLFVRQRREMAEFFGFETRNKYEIQNDKKEVIGFAAEQGKGILGLLLRQVLGHWRAFEIHVFNGNKELAFVAKHPFRILFQRIEVQLTNGDFIGAIQQRFSILYKKFDVLDSKGNLRMEVASPIWKIWTFPFYRSGKQVGVVSKKWSGLFSELMTDGDNFLVDFEDPSLSQEDKQLFLAAAIFIDLQYFENKAG